MLDGKTILNILQVLTTQFTENGRNFSSPIIQAFQLRLEIAAALYGKYGQPSLSF